MRYSHEPADHDVQKIRAHVEDSKIVLKRRRMGAGVHCVTLPDEFEADSITLQEEMCWKGFISLNGGLAYDGRRFYIYGLTPRLAQFDGPIASVNGLREAGTKKKVSKKRATTENEPK